METDPRDTLLLNRILRGSLQMHTSVQLVRRDRLYFHIDTIFHV